MTPNPTCQHQYGPIGVPFSSKNLTVVNNVCEPTMTMASLIATSPLTGPGTHQTNTATTTMSTMTATTTVTPQQGGYLLNVLFITGDNEPEEDVIVTTTAITHCRNDQPRPPERDFTIYIDLYVLNMPRYSDSASCYRHSLRLHHS